MAHDAQGMLCCCSVSKSVAYRGAGVQKERTLLDLLARHLSTATTMEGTLCCPVPHTYVSAQLDIQASIRNLDPLAQEAARTIKPAKCLLYLYDVSYAAIATRWLRPATLTTHLRLSDTRSQAYPRRSKRTSSAQAFAQKTRRTVSPPTCASPSSQIPRTRTTVRQSSRGRAFHSLTATTGRTSTSCSGCRVGSFLARTTRGSSGWPQASRRGWIAS